VWIPEETRGGGDTYDWCQPKPLYSHGFSPSRPLLHDVPRQFVLVCHPVVGPLLGIKTGAEVSRKQEICGEKICGPAMVAKQGWISGRREKASNSAQRCDDGGKKGESAPPGTATAATRATVVATEAQQIPRKLTLLADTRPRSQYRLFPKLRRWRTFQHTICIS